MTFPGTPFTTTSARLRHNKPSSHFPIHTEKAPLSFPGLALFPYSPKPSGCRGTEDVPGDEQGPEAGKGQEKTNQGRPGKNFLRPARNPSLPSFFYAEGNSPDLKKDNEKENE